MSWRTNKAWSDRFVPEIKAILGEWLIDVGTTEEDRFHNTDLITLRMPGDVRIACRIRQHHYLRAYGDEFTLRCSRPSGVETEIDKLLAGWGDYLFYGFADPNQKHLAAWLIGDLHVFRRWIEGYVRQFGDWPCVVQANRDGSSDFVAFAIHDIDPAFIVARDTVCGDPIQL
jgi:hypothetical protein